MKDQLHCIGSRDSYIQSERCVVELERGREIHLTDGEQRHSARLIETLQPLEYQQAMTSGECQLVLSAARAAALGHTAPGQAAVVNLPADFSLSDIRKASGVEPLPLPVFRHLNWQDTPSKQADAALALAKQAAVLPALLLYPSTDTPGHVLTVTVAEARSYVQKPGELIMLSRATIPLATAEQVELVVFREKHGAQEHVAITVGHPDRQQPMVVRLHSSCFTGDILGSMRCDCGEQLQGAISNMAKAGGGIVLYVSQEGRGIGLASKLLAYQLQDAGLDTIEANQHLGFESDARRYHAAGTMLRALGVDQIKLVTNNPLKIEALRNEGINVVGRLPSAATINAHNSRYLETKRVRAGHMSMESAV